MPIGRYPDWHPLGTQNSLAGAYSMPIGRYPEWYLLGIQTRRLAGAYSMPIGRYPDWYLLGTQTPRLAGCHGASRPLRCVWLYSRGTYRSCRANTLGAAHYGR